MLTMVSFMIDLAFVFPILMGVVVIVSELISTANKKRKADKEEIKREVDNYISFEEFSKMMRETTNLKLGE